MQVVVQNDVFSKLILNTLKSYENYTMRDYKEILSGNQLKIADLYNIPIGNVKELVSSLFDKEKYVIHFENLQLYFRLGLKLKKKYIVY